jgi:hypothetical protein
VRLAHFDRPIPLLRLIGRLGPAHRRFPRTVLHMLRAEGLARQ